MNNDVLLELRIENIPARFITSAEAQIRDNIVKALTEVNLKYSSVETYGTYKRLVLFLRDVEPKTNEITQKFYGPSVKMWKDAAGNYTKQAEGFARGKGTTPDKLTTETVPNKGEVLCFVKKIHGIKTEKALSEIFFKIISSLEFPKNMVWEDTRFRFARPIRGIVALYGNKIIPFSIAGIKSGRVTVGLNAKGSKQIKIESVGSYLPTLENANVIVRDEKRGEILINELNGVAHRMNLTVDMDKDLITENLYLTEYPVCVVADYSQDFLELPKELVHLVMKNQLKFFTISDKNGNLKPYFIGIRDGVSKGQQNVEEGFRNVLEARFRDAIFFYTRDLDISLNQFREKLSSVTFQEKLGNMEQRAVRVEKISEWLSNNVNIQLNKEDIKAAAPHAYSDLTSNLVREFTELQGIIGGYYAKHAGLSNTASSAIGEFYQPISPNSPIQSTNEGAVISLAGKTDTLVCDFSLGEIPTGSEDPHGLRRQAYGMARIILEKNIKLNLNDLFTYAYSLLPEAANQRDINVPMEFVWQRAEAIFTEQGFAQDEIKSVKSIFMTNGDLIDCRTIIKDIHILKSNQDFSGIAAVFKRAKNILKNIQEPLTGNTEKSLFETDEEKALSDCLDGINIKCKEYSEQGKYAAALSEILPVKPFLDNFFTKVMVMSENPSVKFNRLNLIKRIVSLIENIADLSCLQ